MTSVTLDPNMNKRFQKLVERARRHDLPEVMNLYGDQPTPMHAAIDQDWLHILMSAVADIAEATRSTAPEHTWKRRKMLRRRLALLHVAAEEWEKRLKDQ